MSERTPSGRSPHRELGARAEEQAVAVVTPEPHAAPSDPLAERRAERLVTGLFLLSALGTVGFCALYFLTSVNGGNLGHLRHVNEVQGLTLTLALGGLGAGLVVWAKRLMGHERAVQERHHLASEPTDQLAAEELFLAGVRETGLPRRTMLKRALGLAGGLLPLPALFALRDLGTAPGTQLRQTGWMKDTRLVELDTGRPIRLGDLPIGGFVTVMPEGIANPNDSALSPTMLIRLAPGENHPLKGHENWAADDHVAYSAVCTHAGCPAKLYEQQTHHILCPCHQSTFDVLHGCRVIFGPAARSLPQLPIYVDPLGYFRASAGYAQPVGPSFWERG
ncbi:MAG TPA: Rieske 2Fe-2S domain-containing protein [Mycobacteriales bacterium]|nr:Rieske 2Fe-2S domain-containing protein [Mycobacteriales bacterium]